MARYLIVEVGNSGVVADILLRDHLFYVVVGQYTVFVRRKRVYIIGCL